MPSTKSTNFGSIYLLEGFSEHDEIWQLDRGRLNVIRYTSSPRLVNFGTLCVYGVEAEHREQMTNALPVDIPRRRIDRNCQRCPHGAVITTYRRHLLAYQRYFAPSGSKMAAKTTSGYSFDGVFRLLLPDFLLESRLLAIYLHVIGHWRLQCSLLL